MPYGIQQPAISGQISQLEKNLGTKLFHRRPFGLTSSGSRLFNEIEPFFAGLTELPNHVRGHTSARLRLAAPGVVLRDYLPKIFEAYKRRYREFRLSVFDANQAHAEDLLRKHEIDLAISELEGKPTTPIQSCTLLRLPLVLVVPKQSDSSCAEGRFWERHAVAKSHFVASRRSHDKTFPCWTKENETGLDSEH